MILVDILVSSYLLTASHPATRLIFSVALSVAEALLARLGAEMRHFPWQWFSIVSVCEVMTTHHQQGLMKISGLGQAEAVGQRERTPEGRSRSECGQFLCECFVSRCLSCPRTTCGSRRVSTWVTRSSILAF